MSPLDPWRLPSGHIAITTEQRLARVPHLDIAQAEAALGWPRLQRPVEAALKAHIEAIRRLDPGAVLARLGRARGAA